MTDCQATEITAAEHSQNVMSAFCWVYDLSHPWTDWNQTDITYVSVFMCENFLPGDAVNGMDENTAGSLYKWSVSCYLVRYLSEFPSVLA